MENIIKEYIYLKELDRMINLAGELNAIVEISPPNNKGEQNIALIDYSNNTIAVQQTFVLSVWGVNDITNLIKKFIKEKTI